MKKLFNLALLLLSSLYSFAQPIITHNDLMTTDDTVRISIASSNAVDFSATGPNSVWDYSFLEASSQELVSPLNIMSGGFLVINRFGPTAGNYASEYYQSFTGIPFDQFGSFLPVNIEDVYRFTRVRSDAQRYTGLSLSLDGNQIAFRSDTIEMVYNFPLTYGDTNRSVGYTRMDFNPFFNANFKQYRRRTSIVDGHGTLITPFGTFNTIRVRHTIRETDSLFVDNPIFPQSIPLNLPTTHEYEWLTNNQKLPVLKITTQVIAGDETVTEVTYRDKFLGLANLSEANITVAVYPNPTKDLLNIKTNQHITKVELVNSIGQLQEVAINLNGTDAQLNLAHLPSGIYHLNVTHGSTMSTKKIILY